MNDLMGFPAGSAAVRGSTSTNPASTPEGSRRRPVVNPAQYESIAPVLGWEQVARLEPVADVGKPRWWGAVLPTVYGIAMAVLFGAVLGGGCLGVL